MNNKTHFTLSCKRPSNKFTHAILSDQVNELIIFPGCDALLQGEYVKDTNNTLMHLDVT